MPKVVLGSKNLQAKNRRRKLNVYQRRKQIMEILRKEPTMTQRDIAQRIGVNKSTINSDMKAMNEMLNVENLDAWAIHRQRVLREVEFNKLECMDRLNRCGKAHQGARWMEEWGKLLEKEIKILGLASPEKVMIHNETTIKTAEADAAVNGVIKSMEVNANNVKVDEDGIIRIPHLKKAKG
jgi:4-hydroxy-3-methylbut-2-en-1-yl diphosphate synthase IspG/GcpE